MKGSFVLKSFPNGINLIINPEVPFEQLLKEIGEKFQNTKAFFGTASVALSIEGKALTPTEESEILETIQKNSDLNVMCIVGKDDVYNQNFVKAIQTLQNRLPSGNYAQIYSGSLKDNALLKMEESIIILGDVNPGCSITSSKNVIVLGSLYGEVRAGNETGEKAYIIALEMEPTSLSIGNFKYIPTKKSKFKLHAKQQPKIAVVKENNVELLPLTKEILETL